MEERKSYTDYCKDFIIDTLPNYEDQTVYMCDLALMLTESINIDGSATYSTYEAQEYIKRGLMRPERFISIKKTITESVCIIPLKSRRHFMCA